MDYSKYAGKRVKVLFLGEETIRVDNWVDLYLKVINNAFTKIGGSYAEIEKAFRNPNGNREYIFNADINNLAPYKIRECFKTIEGITIYADINNSTPKKLRNLDYIYLKLGLKEDWDFQFKTENLDFKTKENINLTKELERLKKEVEELDKYAYYVQYNLKFLKGLIEEEVSNNNNIKKGR